MKKDRYLIEGVLTSVSPIHITDPESARYDFASGRIVYGSKVGVPLTRTRKLSFLDTLADDGDSPSASCPFLPASGMRGRLRRAAAKEVFSFLVAKNVMVHRDAYQGIRCGAVTGSPSGEPPRLDAVQALRDHPMMGLFGGGNSMMPGRLSVSAGYPTLKILYELLMIPDHYAEYMLPERTVGWRDLTQIMPIVRNDDLSSFSDPEAENVIKDYSSVMVAQLTADLGRQTSRKSAMDSDSEKGTPKSEDVTRGLRAWSAVEVIKPGTRFYWRTEANCTDAQAGLLLAATARMLGGEAGAIGGKQSLDYGRVTHQMRLRQKGKNVCNPFSGQGEDTAVDLENPLVARLIDAKDEALDGTTSEELLSVVMGQAPAKADAA